MWRALAETHPAITALIDDHNPEQRRCRLTYAELYEHIRAFAAGLRAAPGTGVQRGEKVALFSENSHRWLVADQAVMWNGAACAVRGATAPAEELDYILQHAQSVALIVETPDVLQKVLRTVNGRAWLEQSVRFVVCLWHGKPATAPAAAAPAAATNGGGGGDEAAASAGASSLPPMYSFDEVLDAGRAALARAATGGDGDGGAQGASGGGAETRARRSSPPLGAPCAQPSDVATLVYTSGTTGHPKGAVLTHANLLHQTQQNCFCREDSTLHGTQDPIPGEVFVSILPCWHIFERVGEYFALARGATMVYSRLLHFRDDLARHRPHLLVAVPRLLESVYKNVQSQVRKSGRMRRALVAALLVISTAYVLWRRRRDRAVFDRAISLPERALAALIVAVLLPLHLLADLIAWRKLRRASVGGRVRTIVSGGGSLAMHLETFYEAIGVHVIVGYGLTETSPVLANRLREHNVRGTTGLPLPGTDIRVVHAEDTRRVVPDGRTGIILVRGAQVFPGYYRDADATAKAIDADGFFNTGDLGFVSPHTGDLVITGRYKDVIVLNNGENVEPSPIEEALLESDHVDQVMLVGQDQRALGALVVPNLDVLEGEHMISHDERKKIEAMRERAAGVKGGATKELEETAAALERRGAPASALSKELRARVEHRKNFVPMERLLAFRLVLAPFSVENGMLTQTLKVKRNVVADNYARLIESMYRD